MEINNKLKFKYNQILHFLFKERFKKKINFNFPKFITRVDLIKKIIKIKNFSSYLEIGCDNNQVFSQIAINDKVGVDPVSGGNFRGTSDLFFFNNVKKFDLIFIDGLHEYDQVCRDISNSLRCLNSNGIILVHDTLPSSLHQQAVPRYKNTWNGDVWKSIVSFRIRPDVDIVTCLIDHGVSIIQKKKNNNILNLNVINFKNKLKFKDFYNNYSSYMRIMNFDEVLNYLKI